MLRDRLRVGHNFQCRAVMGGDVIPEQNGNVLFEVPVLGHHQAEG